MTTKNSSARIFSCSGRSTGGLALIIALGLTGCASAPDSSLPATPAAASNAALAAVQPPSQWSAAQAAAADAQPVAAQWWRDFGSAELDGLVDTALVANRDLQAIAARMAQARALVDGAAAERRPRVDATASVQRGRNSSDDPRAERSVAGLRAGWEVDVFGRGAAAVDAAGADARSAEETLAAARIALAADVATAYFELRTLHRRIVLAAESAQLAELQLNVAQRKFDAGQATALDVERWRAEVAQERALAVELDGSLRVRNRQLALLLGVSRAPTLMLADGTAAPQPPALLLPGALLEQRPDVRRQARALDGALARVGVARRDLYPRVQIEWSGARERLAAIGGSATPVTLTGLGVSLSMPLLDGGRIRANIAVQEARAREAMADYEKAMLAALADVEVGLTQWTAAETALARWQQARNASATATSRAERLYEAGMVDVSAVLDVRRGELRAQDMTSQAEGARWASAVALRRAFAGPV